MELNRLKYALLALPLGVLASCDVTSDTALKSATEPTNLSVSQTTGSTSILGEVWADNWFALHINGQKVVEDSIPITTERSFNAERFNFKANLPMTIAIELRDYVQNETGLEYIGTDRQQMGDGGAIFQFTSKRKLLAASSSSTKCFVVQSAPVSNDCAEETRPAVNSGACAQVTSKRPDNWTVPSFDDSAWEPAQVYSAASVNPKDGYNQIKWNAKAQLIWSNDLVRDNVLLCRLTIGGK